MMFKRALVLAVLLLATLSCTIFLGGPAYPTQTVPASTETVPTFQAQVKTAVAQGLKGDGRVTLTITQEQLTSFIAFHLAKEQSPLLREPQVFLHPGTMEIYGKMQQGNVVSNVKLTLAVTVDAQGKPQIEVLAAEFGLLALPAGFREAIAKALTEAYTGAIGPAATGFRLESITISEGLMTLVGRVR